VSIPTVGFGCALYTAFPVIENSPEKIVITVITMKIDATEIIIVFLFFSSMCL